MRKTRNKILMNSKLDFAKVASWEFDSEFLDLQPKRNFSRALKDNNELPLQMFMASSL